MIKSSPLLLALALPALCAPVVIVNPGGEINNGIDRTAVSSPEVIGWDGTGQVINDRTDYGNGGWRFTFEDSGEIHQMTSHPVELGAGYSLRFDAALFSGSIPGGDFTTDLTLVGPGLLNGDFNADTSPVDGRNFEDTPEWYNLGTASQTIQATRLLPANTALDESRNAVIAANGQRRYALDTSHILTTGEIFRVSYQWRDASNWNDASNRLRVSLFTTDNDLITGNATILQSLDSDLSTVDSSYETQSSIFNPVPASAHQKQLFTSFEAINGGDGFARVENFTLQRGTPGGPPVTRDLSAELYVDTNGSPEVIASRAFDFKSSSVASWHHYHLAIPPGTLDPHAGKTLGIRFRSNDTGQANFQSVDNIRLDSWSSQEASGNFSHNWNSTPDQVWPGPGYWGNRLQDWEVRDNRINCILGSRERRTLHRVGTSIRGDGQHFSLAVNTGLHAGTASTSSRSGFLIGAGPNLDWRGALLVHDALGRDFGLFLGISGDGQALIEDLSTGGEIVLASGNTPATLPVNTRLTLSASHLPESGEYALTLNAFNDSNTLFSTATTTVPSDQILGSFGLLSHPGSGSTRYWFDNFEGSGPALQTEPERHLAILGSMYTLSRGTLKLTAQLPPLDRTSIPDPILEIRDGDTWNQISASPVDNTDALSSYTATFKVADWDDQRDTDFRILVTIDGRPYFWNGTIRQNPTDKEEITLAATTCQRISDGSIQTNGFDWSPVKLWQPHTLAFTHIAKQDPDIFLALGDQIYEGQPTPEDSNDTFIRHHDYLYKWYLWVLQARDLTRVMPTICIPDDHDAFQGNLWGEGGIATTNQSTGGYEEPASWVKMMERTQTSHLPDSDPYNPVQPAPPVAQGIPTYFTGMHYGNLGLAILEDRKFKTGAQEAPTDPDQLFLLGTRQKDFLRAFANDWEDQDLKCVISQSPLGNIHTHANTGYGFGLNDRDTHGWPTHRRNEAWELLRLTRMFQIAGDQHLATFAQHGINGPADAGFSYTAPAIANFFPRCWDPAHNSAGRTDVVNPYKGDFYFDGTGTLPWGQANLNSDFPHHVRVLAAGNPHEYYNQTRNISPAALHDRGAGYGMIRINKTSRLITFETWPLHADPEFPATGSQFDDWPVTISQTDNDGREPTGYLPVIDTGYHTACVISIYDETDGALIYSIRTRDNLVRPPVYDNSRTYRVEVSGDCHMTLTSQSPLIPAAPAINSFRPMEPVISSGASTSLRWDVHGATTATLNGRDVLPYTVDGIGYFQVTPQNDTTYTLVINGTLTATSTVRVPGTLPTPSDPSSAVQGSDAIFTSSIPLDTRLENFLIEESDDLMIWSELPPSATSLEIAETTVTRSLTSLPSPGNPSKYYRARWRADRNDTP